MKFVTTPQVSEITFDDILILPGKSSIPISDEANINIKSKVSKRIYLETPILSSPMPGVTEDAMAIAIGTLGGLGFIHPFQSFERQLNLIEKVKSKKLKVAACVNDMTDEGFHHVKHLVNAKVDLISIETVHAQNLQTIQFIERLKKTFRNIEISVALVVTADATKELIKAGADSIRVGIGGGSHCTTRLTTGIGRPQLSAIYDCARVCKKHGIPLISDTGIKYAGDIAKALAFGADTVMIGGMFSGTDECPGIIVNKYGKKYKYSWGMCTDTAIRQQQLNILQDETVLNKVKKLAKSILFYHSFIQTQKLFEEGVEGLLPYKGSVIPIITTLVQALKRSMWYMGTNSIEQIHKKARIVVVSNNTYQENIPRIPVDI